MITRVVLDDLQVQTPDFRFASAVAEFGLLLNKSVSFPLQLLAVRGRGRFREALARREGECGRAGP